MRQPSRHTLLTLRRATGVQSVTLSSGSYLGFTDLTLSTIQTADLIASYDAYRLKSVTVYVTPQQDAGNSQYSGTSNIHCYLACDTRNDTGTPVSLSVITALENYQYRVLVAGRVCSYKFVPKPLLAVDNNGVTVAAAQIDTNPWLQCTAAGVSLPHHRLLLGLKTSNGSNTQAVDLVYEYVFEVRGIQ